MTDRLASINNELRKKSAKELQATPWLPLESNPQILNAFAKRVGLPPGWEFVDVPSIEPELLPMFLPNPCCAFILLFPCTTNIYRHRREEEQRLKAGASAMAKQTSSKGTPAQGKTPVPLPTTATRPICSDGSPSPVGKVFHLVQHAEFGNACGTVAAVHVLSNIEHCVGTGVMNDKPMGKFIQMNKDKTPSEKGKALFKEESLKESSDAAAQDVAAQTACPDRNGPDLDHHFVAFVCVPSPGGARVVELDGTKWAPVDHGATTPDSFVHDTLNAIRKNFMAVEPDSIEFTLVALMSAAK